MCLIFYAVVSLFRYLLLSCWLFFFKQKTAYEMRISDWSSDVCSSDLKGRNRAFHVGGAAPIQAAVPFHRLEGRAAPGLGRACGHHIGVPGKDQQREIGRAHV